jgi:hypothetical protein
MTEAQFRRVVHSAFYRVVRNPSPLPQAEFFDAKIEDTWPTTPPPTDWSDFWYESVVVEIQGAIMARAEYLDGLTLKWLKDNEEEKWEVVVEHSRTNLVPLQKG